MNINCFIFKTKKKDDIPKQIKNLVTSEVNDSSANSLSKNEYKIHCTSDVEIINNSNEFEDDVVEGTTDKSCNL